MEITACLAARPIVRLEYALFVIDERRCAAPQVTPTAQWQPAVETILFGYQLAKAALDVI
jgi:hypothetical protein